MNTPHQPTHRSRKRLRNPGGAPKGNQNARKHGRYSKLRPADRAAFMRKILRSYGEKDTASLHGARFTDLAAESDTVLHLLDKLLDVTAQLVQARAELNRRNVERRW